MNTTFPRVDTGADPEQVEALQQLLAEGKADEKHRAAQQTGMAIAFFRLGKTVARRTPAKPKRPTKHVRLMQRLAVRSTRTITKEQTA